METREPEDPHAGALRVRTLPLPSVAACSAGQTDPEATVLVVPHCRERVRMTVDRLERWASDVHQPGSITPASRSACTVAIISVLLLSGTCSHGTRLLLRVSYPWDGANDS